MSFRLESEVDDWFRHLSKDSDVLKTKFDVYYLCLMLGFAAGQLDSRGKSAPEFINAFAGDYRPMQRLIIGLLLVVELNRLGIEIAEREAVRSLLSQYIESQEAANLTVAGFARMNEYAAGGFVYLTEQLPEKPHHIETFLQHYVRVLGEAVSKNETWSKFGQQLMSNLMLGATGISTEE